MNPKSVAALMREKFAPVNWLVEGLIPEGTLLIAGRPKSGKSWWALNLMIAAAYGHEFLGAQVKRCGVLYLALEETELRLQGRLRMLLPEDADMEPLEEFKYDCRWPAGATGAAKLDHYLTEHVRCKIVTVDVLKKIRPPEDNRKNIYDLDYEAIDPWKRVADKHHVTLIFVHHTNKGNHATEDPFDAISGSLGLNGVVDQLAVLRRSQHGSTLHMRGRDLEQDAELGLELHNGLWTLVGSAADMEVSFARKAVLTSLRNASSPITGADLARSLGRQSSASTTKLLSRMIEDGLVGKTPTGYVAVLLS